MSKAPPSFDFYYTNWIEGTDILSDRAYRWFLRLLIYQFVNGHIPKTLIQRMNLVGCTDVGEFQQIWDEIGPKFKPIDPKGLCDFEPDNFQENEHVLVNIRMHELRNSRIPVYKNRVASGKKHGKKGGRGKTKISKGSPPISRKGRGKTEDGSNTKEYSLPDSWTEKLRDAVTAWLTYRTEQHGFTYRPQGLKSFLTLIWKECDRYGETAVIDSMLESQAKGYKGWDWKLKNQPELAERADAKRRRRENTRANQAMRADDNARKCDYDSVGSAAQELLKRRLGKHDTGTDDTSAHGNDCTSQGN